MALLNWVKPDERKTSTVIADAVDESFGPRAILRALEEAVPRYISDVDQGKLIYPACKRTLSVKDGNVAHNWSKSAPPNNQAQSTISERSSHLRSDDG